MKEDDIIIMYDPNSSGDEQRFSRDRLKNLLEEAIDETKANSESIPSVTDTVKNIINYLWEELK